VIALKKSRLLNERIELTNQIIKDYSYLCRFRTKPKYFSKEGKLGFVNLVSFVLNMVKKTLQIELDDFFSLIKQNKNQVTKQAFSKARNKIGWEGFKELYDMTVKTAYTAEDLNYYEGFRLCAIDGTSVAVDNSEELLSYFGSSGAGGKTATARVSCLFDGYYSPTT